MKTFYEKLKKNEDLENAVYCYSNKKSAKAFASLSKSVVSNCTVHVRRGNRVVIKPHCRADCWALVAHCVLTKSAIKNLPVVQKKMNDILKFALIMVKKRCSMQIIHNGRIVTPIQMLNKIQNNEIYKLYDNDQTRIESKA